MNTRMEGRMEEKMEAWRWRKEEEAKEEWSN